MYNRKRNIQPHELNTHQIDSKRLYVLSEVKGYDLWLTIHKESRLNNK